MHTHELLYCPLTETLIYLWGLAEVNVHLTDGTCIVSFRQMRDFKLKLVSIPIPYHNQSFLQGSHVHAINIVINSDADSAESLVPMFCCTQRPRLMQLFLSPPRFNRAYS